MWSVVRRIPLLALLALAPVPTVWSAREAPSPAGVSIDRAEDGLFYVDAMVNGRAVHFLVDTGATHVTLSAADAARVGLDPRATRYGGSMTTAAGATPMRWTRLAKIEVAGRRVEDLPAAVVDRGLPVSLLGQDLLSRLDSVRIEGDRLSLG
jgi:aspartyl protease family protein